MQHTPEQAAVIAAACGNLLVSAAAGSGKTAVLTDRIVQRIIGGELDIRSVLVMTFTEAAARNMKAKVEEKLRTALDGTAEVSVRQRLNRQLSLLPTARISTIHAFCLDVIRNFYTCALDEKGQPLVEPDFAIDDGVEADLLLRQTLDDYLGSQYEAIDLASSGDSSVDFGADRQAAFYRLIEGYGSAGSDQPVRDLILRLHHFLRSLPDYPQQVDIWLSDLRSAAADFSASEHLQALLRLLRLLLDRALDHLDEMEDLLAGGIRFIAQPDRNQEYQNKFAVVCQILRQLNNYLLGGGHDWDQIRTMTAELSSIDLPRANKADSPEKQAFMDLFCRHAAEVIFCLSGSCGTAKCSQHFIFSTRHTFSLPSSEIEADIAAQLPAVEMLFELVLGLDREYSRLKKAAGIIDFSDFEHLALVILRQDEARQYYRSRYSEVYVDEYQDTSSIQEEIIRAVSDSNCLMVGDIKQSIYRFRHARPRIFIERAARYQDCSDGILHILNKNFRSVTGILQAANDLFSQLMSKGAGEIDYDDRQALAPHRPNDPVCPHPVSLLLLNRAQSAGAAAQDEEENTSASDLSRHQQEALAVVRQMQILRTQGIEWQDMVVLSRTRGIGQTCRALLESYGIPVQTDSSAAFLDSPVLRQMEALINVLDNIRQDIPLAAVLRSEVCQGGYSAEQLVQIRLEARRNHPELKFFHQAVMAYAAEGSDPELRHRLADSLSWLNKLRLREQYLSLGELIGQIFAESGWLDRLAAHQDGESKIRELRQFQQWAEKFETRRQRGLHAFAAYIASLRRQETVESPFATVEVVENAVRIMTIHGSKGLEFPVVFIIGTGYDLTPKDSQDSLLISETLGIGMDFADPEQQIRYPTHLKLAMLEELKAAGLAEELRLLYVAMTRAMDQLYIVGSVKVSDCKGENRLSALAQQAKAYGQHQLPDYLVLAGKTYLDWLILALARQPGLDLSWLEGGDFPSGEYIMPSWRIEYQQWGDLLRESECWPDQEQKRRAERTSDCDPAALLELAISGQEQSDDSSEIEAQINLRVVAPYRYEQAARSPVKLTVSELKHREQASDSPFAAEDGVPATQARGINLTLSDQSGSDEQAATLGTLLHVFFRYLDLTAARRQPELNEIRRQLDLMAESGMLTETEKDALTAFENEFLNFIQSDLADEMAKAAGRPDPQLHQEMPFTLVLPAAQVYNDSAGLGPDDKVLVQGIIDCWFMQSDGITLVDYKSDRLTTDPHLCQLELERRYSPQMNYYARAIEAATGKKVVRRLIWLIRQSRIVALKTKENQS